MNIGFELKESVAALEASILNKHPTMPVLLAKIHKTLSSYPEQVVLLSPEEISSIVMGLQLHTQVIFADAVVKDAKKVTSTKAGKTKLIGLLDLL